MNKFLSFLGRRKRLMLLSLLLALIFLLGIVFFTSIPNRMLSVVLPANSNMLKSKSGFSRKNLDSSSIKLLIWNVYKGKKKGWADDFQILMEAVDLGLLQEAYLDQKMSEVINVAGMGWDFAVSFDFGSARVSTGVLTLSNTEPNWKQNVISKYKEPIFHTPKVSLVTMYSLTGATNSLLVINTHAINFVGMRAFESQMYDLEALMKKHSGPIIFAGDLNIWREKRKRVVLEMANRLDLTAVVFRPDHRTSILGNKLDHVFYRGLKVVDASVLKNIDSSDHKPMIVSFSL